MRFLFFVSATLLSLANEFKLFPLLAHPPRKLVAVCGLLAALTAVPAHAQTCAPPPSGLVAWWPLDETGGSAVSDHSALGLNPGIASGQIGTGSNNNPRSATGLVGNGLNFWAQSRVKIAAHPSLDFGTSKSFTIDAWINGRPSPIVSNYDSNTNTGYSLFVAANNKLRLDMRNGTSIITWDGPTITPNVWTFVAVVVDRQLQTVTFYAGAANLSPIVVAPPIPSTTDAGNNLSLKIGGCTGSGAECNMVIDEVEIFDRVVAQTELQKIVTAGKTGKCSIPKDKGMTWIHSKSDVQTGTITVGCNGCDAYHGDTVCTELRPLLCIYKPTTPFQVPKGLSTSAPYNLWSGGVVATTEPVVGMNRAAADSRCYYKFGDGWRAAEFHDGGIWNFQAYGGTVSAPTVPSTRFWVFINDQPDANCQ